jgi:hypothetical protein
LGFKAIKYSAIGECEVTSWVFKTFPESSNREGLTRGSSDEKIDICSKIPLLKVSHITIVSDVGIVMSQHSTRKKFNLCKPYRVPA